MRLQLLAGGVIAGLVGLILATSPASASTPRYDCLGAQTTLFDNTNGDLITDTGSPPSFSTKGKSYCMTYIQTYHWNGGNGAAPGTLGINRVGGSMAGVANSARFAATGTAGQGGPNENWYADVPDATNPTVLDGSYTCYDSDPSTWSADKASGGAGFCIVKVVPAIPVASTTTSATTTAAAGPPTSSSGGGGSDLTWLWILLAVLGVGVIGLGTYGVVKARQEEKRNPMGEILLLLSGGTLGQRFDMGPPPMGPQDPLVDPDPVEQVPGDSSGPEPDDVM